MKKFIAIALILILLCGCTPKPQSLTSDFTKKIESITGTPSEVFEASQSEFAVELLKQNFNRKNTLVSPLSVKLALAMVFNGADGETKAQMEKLFGLTADENNQELAKYLSSLASEANNALHVANSIWFRNSDFTVKNEFLQKNADYYNAGIFKEAFDNKTVKQINSWVKENTHDMIDSVIDEIDPDTMMLLINALAFEAEWVSPYKKGSIKDGTFTALNGQKQSVEMMHSNESIYLEDENATGFIKHYKEGNYAFAALLPKDGINSYLSSLDGAKISSILSGRSNATVRCAMPKFKFDFSTELTETLQNMGMTDAFNSELADLSEISDFPLHISKVIHKTHITVDEKGTKAGAVTAAMTNGASAPIEKPKEVILDRPFVFMIIDLESNLPIFMGALTDVK